MDMLLRYFILQCYSPFLSHLPLLPLVVSKALRIDASKNHSITKIASITGAGNLVANEFG
jgi:hypothetical protein